MIRNAGEGTAERVFDDVPRTSRWGRSISESTVPGLVGVLDGLVVFLVGVAYYLSYVGWSLDNYQIYVSAIVIDVVLTVSLFHFAKLYAFETIVAWPRGLRRLAMVSGAVFLFMVALAFALKISAEFSRVWFFSSFLTSVLLLFLLRGVFRLMIARWARAGHLVRNVAVVGFGDQARQLLQRMRDHDTPWKRVVGIFDDRATRIEHEVFGYRVLGDLDDLVGCVRSGRIDDIVVTLPWNADQRLVTIIDKLRELPVHVYLGSDLIGYHFPRHSQGLIEGAPVLEIVSTPLSGWGVVVKLLEDKILAGLMLLLFAPLMLACSIAIRLESRGPILFRQARYGYNNETIMVYKFRSMYHGRPPDDGVPQATRKDPRVTRVGWFLRRTSLDELPQLFNVLLGNMSLVGPRPHAVEHNEQYSALIGGYFTRHKVKPGITGWAQVNGLRGETDTLEKMQARVEHDIFYVENWSLFFDLQIILMTALVGMVHKEAY